MAWMFDYCAEETAEVPEHLRVPNVEACQGCDASGKGECSAILTWIEEGGASAMTEDDFFELLAAKGKDHSAFNPLERSLLRAIEFRTAEIERLRTELAAERAEVERLRAELGDIAYNTSTSVPLGQWPVHHYHEQLRRAISIAANALTPEATTVAAAPTGGE